MVVDFETSFYFHKEGEGVLMGMSNPDEPPSFRDDVDWDFLDPLTDVAVHRFPALAGASIRRAWAGLYEVTPDCNPILGSVPQIEGLYVAAGFSGHGFMHGPITGEIIADLILGRSPAVDVHAFSVKRFFSGQRRREAAVV